MQVSVCIPLLTMDEATGFGMVPFDGDLDASNEQYRETLQDALTSLDPAVEVTFFHVREGQPTPETRITVTGTYDDDYFQSAVRDIIQRIFGQGEFWR